MDAEETIELAAKLLAQELALSLLIAIASKGRADVVGRMHTALQGLISDAVRNVGAAQPELSTLIGDQLEALAGQHLDRIFSTASQLK